MSLAACGKAEAALPVLLVDTVRDVSQVAGMGMGLMGEREVSADVFVTGCLVAVRVDDVNKLMATAALARDGALSPGESSDAAVVSDASVCGAAVTLFAAAIKLSATLFFSNMP